MRREDEKGAALLTVMLMVAVISVIAVGVLDDIRFGVRRTLNARIASQAQWYALGAEQLARTRIAQLMDREPNKTTLEGGWNGRVISFPIEQGRMEAKLTDATGCFNLNSVVEANQGEPFRRRELGVRQFTTLLSLVGVSNGPELAENLADWMDSNDVGRAEAEDPGYAQLAQPYRTAGGPLAEVSELRAIRGFTPSVYAALRPYVCALPTTDLSPINVNTLPPERALLLTALTEGRIGRETAARVLSGRPVNGWPDAQAFWGQQALVATPPGDVVRDQIKFRTRFFALDSQIVFADMPVFMTALFETPSASKVILAARRWTPEE
ncbi:general secretion pathway protein GspK [Caulobacter vibrioides]|uniref:Type II secretion system protein K n=2 Tax=Caulobacter vibrioides TaxID=155892 RepID=Q9ABP6_CAUVC|nr:type II secretion system minor pseudopilin GspK [Caulobacter vibrioides]YP_002515554.1 type II secretion pathway protein K [Caulobacter vibrioides NA1000]AAK22167.1 general secretion pathway protein K [Caulobacter vibrioides CB15]ACL93646.1 type II secretion pathway protein K [Caulobacter vibrioides NA1000]ATC23197.1 general secretion pathway protein GspK [Caulobacter vibrioides]ATC27014.1 general secretion pathway protein GspK [Caulobacter vibrioides]AZH11405.1 general secretion pathway p